MVEKAGRRSEGTRCPRIRLRTAYVSRYEWGMCRNAPHRKRHDSGKPSCAHSPPFPPAIHHPPFSRCYRKVPIRASDRPYPCRTGWSDAGLLLEPLVSYFAVLCLCMPFTLRVNEKPGAWVYESPFCVLAIGLLI